MFCYENKKVNHLTHSLLCNVEASTISKFAWEQRKKDRETSHREIEKRVPGENERGWERGGQQKKKIKREIFFNFKGCNLIDQVLDFFFRGHQFECYKSQEF